MNPTWMWYGRHVDPRDIVHIPWFTQPYRVRGLSPIGAFRLTCGVGLGAQEYGAAWFNNGGVPPGTFRNTAQKVSKEDADLIEAIISLPPGLFYGTGIPACVLVINKHGASTRKHVLFIRDLLEANRAKRRGHVRNRRPYEHRNPAEHARQVILGVRFAALGQRQKIGIAGEIQGAHDALHERAIAQVLLNGAQLIQRAEIDPRRVEEFGRIDRAGMRRVKDDRRPPPGRLHDLERGRQFAIKLGHRRAPSL
jgi:hypothetical protein